MSLSQFFGVDMIVNLHCDCNQLIFFEFIVIPLKHTTMKNKFQSTIDAVVDKARDIADKVGDVVESTVETVATTAQAVTNTIDTIDDVAATMVEAVETAPKLEEVMQAMIKDARVGHFIVDILSGMNVNEASSLHFPSETTTAQESKTQIDSLVDEAEQRGYLRGRNEQIEVKMRDLDRYQQSHDDRPSVIETTILNHPRQSVWD